MNGSETMLNPGEEVVKAAGELDATAKTVVEAAKDTTADHEQVQGWLTTIFKALFAVLK